MIDIRSLGLDEIFSTYKGIDGDGLKYLQPVSKINIFVGSNNSGKSRFMRLLSSQSDYTILPKNVNLGEINAYITSSINIIRNTLINAGLSVANDIEESVLDNLLAAIPEHMNMGTDNYQKLRDNFTKWSDFPDIHRTSSRGSMGLGHISDQNKVSLRNTVREQSAQILEHLTQIPIQSEADKPKRVYIPILRGLRPLDDNHNDLYAERTRKDYFPNTSDGLEIFTGLSLYQRLIDMLLGDNRQRKSISDYQEFVSNALFESRPIALIPNPKEKVVVVKIGQEKEQPIHHLGDGIQSAIILSFLPYVTRESTCFFIEEPEMFLHPGLQRKILNLYNSLSHHSFFLTTHSNHFLDITIDIKETSIFTFRKILDQQGDDEQVPNFTVGRCNIASVLWERATA